jgi:hypothetical protein
VPEGELEIELRDPVVSHASASLVGPCEIEVMSAPGRDRRLRLPGVAAHGDQLAGPAGARGAGVPDRGESVLRRLLGGRRLRLSDDDRRKLAARAYRLGRAALREVATIVTPDTVSDGIGPFPGDELPVRRSIKEAVLAFRLARVETTPDTAVATRVTDRPDTRRRELIPSLLNPSGRLWTSRNHDGVQRPALASARCSRFKGSLRVTSFCPE